MLQRWLPLDRTLRRALYGLLIFIVCLAVAGGMAEWDRERSDSPERSREAVAQAVWQYGPSSQQAADAIRQLGEAGNPNDVVALLDPSTGKAIAAWPADLTGKSTEAMAPANGLKLPPLSKLMGRRRIELRATVTGGKEFSVRVDPLYPTGEERGDRGGFDLHIFVKGDRHSFGLEDRRAFNSGEQPHQANPEAILLQATQPEGVTPIRAAAAGLGALAALGFVLYWLSIAWWVFADARRRGSRAFAWGVLTLLTNLVGAAVYLVARREVRHCPRCGGRIDGSFNHCPSCGQTLKRQCASCGQSLQTGWSYCANCGTPADPDQ